MSLLFAVGHLAGFWRPSPGDRTQQAAQYAMTAHRFHLVGSERTYWDLYLGFGFIIGVFILTQAIVLWLLANLERRHVGAGRAITFALVLGNAAILAFLVRFLFIIPQLFEAAVVLLLLLALSLPSGSSEVAESRS